jgi:hypothetical protein
VAVGDGCKVGAADSPHAMRNNRINVRGVNINTLGFLNQRYAMNESPYFKRRRFTSLTGLYDFVGNEGLLQIGDFGTFMAYPSQIRVNI